MRTRAGSGRGRLLVIGVFAALVGGPGTSTAAEPEPPADADSVGQPAVARDHLVLRLEGDVVLLAVRVERASQDNLMVILVSGERKFVPTYKVRAIEDERGVDRTDDVIRRYQKLDLGAVADPGRKRRAALFRGFPLPERKRYWLMEFGYIHPVATEKPGKRLTGYGVWQLARLTNLDERFAIGPALQVEVGGDEVRFDALARGRRWLAPDLSAELAAGISLGTGDSGRRSVKSTSPAFVVQGAMNVRDLVLLTAQAETYRREIEYDIDPLTLATLPGFTQRGVQASLGVRAGGELGFVGTAATVLVGATFLLWVIAAARTGS